MSKKFKGKTVEVKVNWLDLDDMKAVCKTILECNIAVKSFQLRHTDDEKYREIMNQSILNSKQGLEKVDSIQNVETINMIIWKCVGQTNWATFVGVLGGFSGSLNDPNFYEADAELSRRKAEEVLKNKEK